MSKMMLTIAQFDDHRLKGCISKNNDIVNYRFYNNYSNSN